MQNCHRCPETSQTASVGLFVRKVRTGSGAAAVQIARTRRGKQTILEHLGSAYDDAQLAALVVIARERIAEMTRSTSEHGVFTENQGCVFG